jgi:A/G-specific adenine glycosylase
MTPSPGREKGISYYSNPIHPIIDTSFVVNERRFAVSPDKALLDWYDRNARALPWRAPPGKSADPYRVWLSEIMLQQTGVKTVIPYFEAFITRFPNVEAMARTERDEVLRLWAGLGYYSRARNLHACAVEVVEQHGGRFPDSVEALLKLPGIGDYTAGAIAAIAFGQKVAAVDGNVERVISRFYAVEEAMPKARPTIKQLTQALVPERAGDFAQSLMDLGATICTPKNPLCGLCPLSQGCAARKSGTMLDYPRKTPAKAKAMRYGAAFVVRREDGAVLIGTRPEKGLLGGMVEVPNTAWTTQPMTELQPPVPASWQKCGTVDHVFTHFPLRLDVYAAEVAMNYVAPPPYRWSSPNGPDGEALPTLFRKVLAASLPSP